MVLRCFDHGFSSMLTSVVSDRNAFNNSHRSICKSPEWQSSPASKANREAGLIARDRSQPLYLIVSCVNFLSGLHKGHFCQLRTAERWSPFAAVVPHRHCPSTAQRPGLCGSNEKWLAFGRGSVERRQWCFLGLEGFTVRTILKLFCGFASPPLAVVHGKMSDGSLKMLLNL